jgi:hypothetical protein
VKCRLRLICLSAFDARTEYGERSSFSKARFVRLSAGDRA